MNDAEKAIGKKLLHMLADDAMPALLDAEVSKLPEPYMSVVKLILADLEPKLLAALDAKIDAL